MENICKFVPKNSSYQEDLQIINFVYEADNLCANIKNCSLYRMNIVVSGSAEIEINGISHVVKKGDTFFLAPAFDFFIKNPICGKEKFCYMYISFLGTRASNLFDRLGITRMNNVFFGYTFLTDFWKTAITEDENPNSDIFIKGVLLYSLSKLEAKVNQENELKINGDKISGIKEYIDKNYSDSKLSLKSISDKLFYSPKYISILFKKHFGIYVMDYIKYIRMQKACELLKGDLSIKEIAFRCGFSDQLYFSKVFKSVFSITPSEYRTSGKGYVIKKQ